MKQYGYSDIVKFAQQLALLSEHLFNILFEATKTQKSDMTHRCLNDEEIQIANFARQLRHVSSQLSFTLQEAAELKKSGMAHELLSDELLKQVSMQLAEYTENNCSFNLLMEDSETQGFQELIDKIYSYCRGNNWIE